MSISLKYEIWDTKNENHGYWVLRNDGACWEFPLSHTAIPKLLGNVYVPKGDKAKHWERLHHSEIPEHIRRWLLHCTKEKNNHD